MARKKDMISMYQDALGSGFVNVLVHLMVFFQIFVNGDVDYAQTREVLTLKNLIEPP